MKIYKILWLVPIFAFVLGYFIFEYIFSEKAIPVPQIVGKNIKDAVKILSKNRINIRIIAEKEDSDLKDGTVIEQRPQSSKIKPNQSVYLIISKKIGKLPAPNVVGKNIKDTEEFLKNKSIKYKINYIENRAKKDTVFAQIPKAGSEVNGVLNLFVSQGLCNYFIMPNLVGLSKNDVVDFLILNEIKYTLENQKGSVILAQSPQSGSIIKLENLIIQLK